jgi:hypothetical protein
MVGVTLLTPTVPELSPVEVAKTSGRLGARRSRIAMINGENLLFIPIQ